MSRFDGLAVIAIFGQTHPRGRSPEPEQAGRFGFRNAQGEIVEVDAPRVAKVIDPMEMFNVNRNGNS